MNNLLRFLPVVLVLVSTEVFSAPGMPALTVTPGPDGTQSYSVSIQILLMMTALSLLPAGLMMMTSFTRIIIVLAILRQALGTATTPSNQIIVGLAIFLTFFIMMPVFEQAYTDGFAPYMEEKLNAEQAFEKALVPFREFMIGQTRETDLQMFAEISGVDEIESPETIPFSLLVPSFVTSELKTAFQIGFLIFIPFLIIDLVVASVLMSMGMMMLSPMLISLPFKLMLFVLADGWAMVIGTLASSFYV